jgi:hypothetical protein
MTLNLNPEPASSKKSKNYKKALRVGGAVSLVGIGSTFAANISLNQGANVEFGQGVAQTAACDADGFSITPVTSYDNAHSIFRVDSIQVSGLNLTPVGTGYSAAGYGTQDEAKTAHPGQYYDGSTWKRTCDGVVLDFAAYTDDVAYANYTRGVYDSSQNYTSTSKPVAWSQQNGLPNEYDSRWHDYNTAFAIIIDTADGNGGETTNFGIGWDTNDSWGVSNYMAFSNLDHSDAANSSFSFYSKSDVPYNGDMRPNAASIAKITVSSMSHFPTDYYLDNGSGIGRA